MSNLENRLLQPFPSTEKKQQEPISDSADQKTGRILTIKDICQPHKDTISLLPAYEIRPTHTCNPQPSQAILDP